MEAIRYSADRKRALCRMHGDKDDMMVVGSVMANGEIRGARWECSASHFEAYAEVYANRFPVEAAPLFTESSKPVPMPTGQVTR